MSTTKRPARPDDKPFDFNLDAVQASAESRPFVAQWGGRRWTFEHLELLDAWGLLDAADQGDTEAMRSVFRLALGDDWPDFRGRPMPGYKLRGLFEAYQAHCGLKPGESPASDGS